jgi:hypothetical protein
MVYRWLLLGHLLAVAALLINHGVSMYVLFAIRDQTDRQKILDLITLSGRSILPMYISIGLIVVFGFLLAIEIDVLGAWWIWLSVIILLVVIGLMTATAKPYFARVKEACELRPSGVPRVSDEELQQILHSGNAGTITAIGAIGLVAIFYLMIFKPFS